MWLLIPRLRNQHFGNHLAMQKALITCSGHPLLVYLNPATGEFDPTVQWSLPDD